MKLGLKKGFGVVEKNAHDAEVRREQAKDRIMAFYGPKKPTRIRFLTEEPLCYKVHPLAEKPFVVYCSKENDDIECPYCNSGTKTKDEYAWLIWDYTPFEVKVRDASGKETGEVKKVSGSVKKLTRGLTDAMKLKKKSAKYGLTNRDYIVEKGATQTSGWEWDEQDEEPMTNAQIDKIRATLNKRIRNLDLYDVLMKQIVPPTLGADEVSREQARDAVEAGVHVDSEEDDSEEEEEQETKTHKKFSFKKH